MHLRGAMAMTNMMINGNRMLLHSISALFTLIIELVRLGTMGEDEWISPFHLSMLELWLDEGLLYFFWNENFGYN
jgi:hypothetical protein